jgi:hypothetical protein
LDQTIQIKRGLKEDLPILADGEMGFCRDTKQVYIGDGTENTLINKSYTHSQISAQSDWTINHNLNCMPTKVTIVDSGGSVVIGDVKYIDNDTITVHFGSAFSGKAYIG